MTKNKGQKRLPPKAKVPLTGSPEKATIERIEAMVQAPRPGPKGKSQLTPPQQQVDNNQFLRFSAGLYYTTDLQGTTMAQMAKHPLFGTVSVDTLANWSTQDRWVDRRRQNLSNWRRTIENKIGSELVKLRTDQLAEMRTVFDKMMGKLTRGRLQAKSYEGMVTAMVRLAQLMDDWNEKLFRTVIPDIPVASVSTSLSPAASSTKPRLSTAEARKAAVAILEMRRHEMRAETVRLEAEKEGKPVDLKVVQGASDGDNADGVAQSNGGGVVAAAGHAVQGGPAGPPGKA